MSGYVISSSTTIYKGNILSGATVVNGGYVAVGGAVSNVMVSAGGNMDVGFDKESATYFGTGAASGTRLISGTQWLYSGANALDTIVSSGGFQGIRNGGVASGSVISSGGRQQVLSGGVASNSIADSGGTILLDTGGTVTGAAISAGGFLQNGNGGGILGGFTAVWGTLSGGTIVSDGYAAIAPGGVASGVTLLSGGAIWMLGGTANNVTVSAGGIQRLIFSDAKAFNTIVSSGGLQEINNGVASGSIATSGGTISLYTGGIVVDATISAGGLLQNGNGGGILSGVTTVEGTLSGGTIVSGAYAAIVPGGVASGVTQLSGGYMAVGGTASNVTVSAGGNMDVGFDKESATYFGTGAASGTRLISGTQWLYFGAKAFDTIVSPGGFQGVRNGGVASGSVISSGGRQQVLSGGVASRSIAASGGTISLDTGGIVADATISAGGFLQNGNGGGILSGVTTVGGTLSGGTIVSGAYATIVPGGVASGVTQLSGGYMAVGGTASNVTVSAGGNMDVGFDKESATYFGTGIVSGTRLISGTQWLYSGAKALDTIVSLGGFQGIRNGGVASGSVILSGGRQQVLSGGVASGSIAASGGTISLDTGGTVADATISAGGFLQNGNGGGILSGVTTVGGTLSGGTIVSGGTVNVTSGGSAAGVTASSGFLTVGNAGILSGGTILNGGSLTLVAGATLSGLLSIGKGASATIDVTAGGTVNLAGTDYTSLIFTGTTSPTTVLSGFNGAAPGKSDQIVLKDIPRKNIIDVSYPDDNHVTLHLRDGSSFTMNIPGVKTQGYALSTGSDGSTTFEVCFLKGTLIETPEGPRAVETLEIGDEIFVFRNGVRETETISWVGGAQCTLRPDQMEDRTSYPVRILKDALAEGVPFKDMLITPEHCLFLDNCFVPVRMLVNERTIYHDTSLASFDYYHVETRDHSIIMADGVLTESYLDTGNRRTFSQHGAVVSIASRRQLTWADAAAPLNVARDFVEPLHRSIESRAVHAGHDLQYVAAPLTSDAEIHLVTEAGAVISKLREVNGHLVFMIPAHIETVYLVSNTSRPCDTIGPFVDDRRQLGVLVGSVFLYESDQTYLLKDHLEKSALYGWHNLEDGHVRWTNGNAMIPLGAREDNISALLIIQVIEAGPYVVSHKICHQENAKAVSS